MARLSESIFNLIISKLGDLNSIDDKNPQYLKLTPTDGNKAPIFLSNEHFIRIEDDENVTVAALTKNVEGIE